MEIFRIKKQKNNSLFQGDVKINIDEENKNKMEDNINEKLQNNKLKNVGVMDGYRVSEENLFAAAEVIKTNAHEGFF